jgi:hypothetical protein
MALESEFRKTRASDEQEISTLRYSIEQFSSKIREYSQINDKCDDMETKISLATEEI